MGLEADSTRYCYGMYDLRQFYPSYWNIERERTRNNLHFMSTDSRFLCSCGLISIRFNTFDSIIDDSQIIQIGGSKKNDFARKSAKTVDRLSLKSYFLAVDSDLFDHPWKKKERIDKSTPLHSRHTRNRTEVSETFGSSLDDDCHWSLTKWTL